MPQQGRRKCLGVPAVMAGTPLSLSGIIPALVTPFHEDESLDLATLREMVEHVIAGGVHGVFVLGSQGEFYALTDDEQRTVVEAAVEAADNRVPVFAGASAITTRAAAGLAEQAQSAGAHAVTVLPPFFIRPSDRELHSHYAAIAGSIDIPLILYNQPQRTGVTLTTNLVAGLASIRNVAGIKDSSASLNQTLDYLSACPEDFRVLIGNDGQIAYALMAGASGTISATANVVPRMCIAIFEAVRAGLIERAISLQRDLSLLRATFDLGTFPIVIKEALTLAGRSAGPCRGPVGPLSSSARARVREVLAQVGAVTTRERAHDA
jgi:4-hydroxy-tetrahydrodipicolinate synthase